MGSSKGSPVFKAETRQRRNRTSNILRDPALTFFPKHKFTSYKQMTTKHLHVTNIKAASYGTHSRKSCSAHQLQRKNYLKANKGGRRTSLCIDLALGPVRQRVAAERHRVKENTKQWWFREGMSCKTGNWAHT